MSDNNNNETRPNIIWIQSDQHNPSIIGAYGDPIVETPNLDNLAANGTIINNAYCASPICVPSRMSAITGRYPHETQVWTNDQTLNSAFPTIAHSLGSVGYIPVQLGRMHFNGIDQFHGFSERIVGDHSPNYPGSPRQVNHGVLQGTAGPSRISLEKSGKGQNAYEVHDEEVAEKANLYFTNLQKEQKFKKNNTPFFISIGLMLPHQPFVARSKDFNKYDGKVGLPKFASEPIENCHPYIQWWRRRTGIESVSENEIIRARTAYWALCDRTDALIGKILSSLKENKLLDNAVVIYTSDHGEQLGERGLWWKQTFYENSAKVPAIISWPKKLPKGQILNNVINQFDLNSTLLDIVKAPSLPRSQGRSLLEMLQNNGEGWNNTAFSEYCMDDSDTSRSFSANLGGKDIHAKSGGVQNRMIRQDNWKLNYYHGYDPELFNLEDDPLEKNDLCKDKSFSGIKSTLMDQIFDGWDPNQIRSQMRILKQEQTIMEDWASNIDPDDQLRWNLNPEYDQLEN